MDLGNLAEISIELFFGILLILELKSLILLGWYYKINIKLLLAQVYKNISKNKI